MKKMMFLAAIAAVALQGCVKETSHSTIGNELIGFKAFNEVAARGPIDGETYPDGGEFKVFAVYNNGSAAYFEPTTFAKEGTVWTGETPRYWPTTGVLDFAAYHPAALAGTVTPTYSGGISKIEIAGIDNKDTQEDIMFSNLIDDAACTNHTSRSMVFNHALAQVEVKVKATEASIYTITGITLKETIQGGTLTISPATASTAEWTPSSTKVDMPVVSADTPVTAAATTVGNNVLVVPANQTKLVVNYKIVGSNATFEHPIDLTSYGAWVMGKKYIYTITFGADEISFSPKVTDWGTPVEPSVPSI